MTRPENFFSMEALAEGMQRTLAPGIGTSIFVGDQAMFSVVEFEPNAVGSVHQHPEEQWGVLLEGSGTRIQNGEEVPVEEGAFWRTPGDVPHGFIAGPDGARVLDVFAPPREDYRRAGSGFAAEPG